MEEVKCVVVGDGYVGKTCLLISYTTSEFPQHYVPTIFDTFATTLTVGKKPIYLRLYDTAGQEDYDKLRPLSYPRTDIFLVCFAIDSHASFEHVKSKWVPELKVYNPNTPYILVGMKADVRENEAIERELSVKGQKMISPEQGAKLAKDVRAECYIECSAKTKGNVERLFEEAVKAGSKGKATVNKRKFCIIL